MLDARYADAWTARVGARADGLTCCQDSDLLNRDSLLHERIDLAFTNRTGQALAKDGVGTCGRPTMQRCSLRCRVRGSSPWRRGPRLLIRRPARPSPHVRCRRNELAPARLPAGRAAQPARAVPTIS